MKVVSIVFITALLSSAYCSECESCTDLTRIPEASGAAVVLACTRLIQQSNIFSDDYEALRRIAYVETADGTNAFTYAPGYSGGIWGVRHIVLEYTKNASSSILNKIFNEFRINWTKVEMEQMKMPLYSAIAARIYLQQYDGNLSNSAMQKSVWQAYNGEKRCADDYDTALNISHDNFLTEVMRLEVGSSFSEQIKAHKAIYFNMTVADDPDILVLDLSVTSGQAALYVSNLVLPSEAVHCGIIKTNTSGYIQINTSQMISYGSDKQLFITITAIEDTEMEFHVTPVKLEGVPNVESESDEFVIGMFSNHPDAGCLPITLLITTTEIETVNFTIEALDGLFYEGTVNHAGSTEVFLPPSYVVSNVTKTNKGLAIKTEGGKRISVSVSSHYEYSSDSYLALPLIAYTSLEEYIYYAVTPDTNITGLMNRVLLVGGYDNTTVTVTPTEDVDVSTVINQDGSLLADQSYTFSINRLETILLESEFPLTGTKVVTNKPITFLSGHQCAVVPESGGSCDFAIEQFPPTINWGKTFIFPMLSSRTGGSYFTLMAAEENTVADLWCSLITNNANISHQLILTNAGEYKSLEIAPDDVVCSITADKPVLVSVLGTSENADENNGDPLLFMIPPVEQYSTNISYTIINEHFNSSFVNLVVTGDYNDILIDNITLSSQWSPILASNLTADNITAYATHLQINDSETHNIATRNATTKFSAVIYGFKFSVGYGQRTGMTLHPVANKFGSLSLSVQSSTQEIGKDIQLTCTVTGAPTYAIRWLRGGEIISPSCKYSIASNDTSMSVLTIHNVSFNDDGEYECIARSYYTEPVNEIITVNAQTVEPPTLLPPMLAPIDGQNVFGNVINASVIISLSIDDGSADISWQHEDSLGKICIIEPDENTKFKISQDHLSLKIMNLQLADAGIIRIAARNNAGTNVLAITLDVYVAAAFLYKDGSSVKRMTGENVSFNCTADGINRPEIKWTKNGVVTDNTRHRIVSLKDQQGIPSRSIPGLQQINSSLTISDLRQSDSGNYSCIADNKAEIPVSLNLPFVLNVSVPNPCKENSPLCQNNGKCKQLNVVPYYSCICEKCFTGTHCETEAGVIIAPTIEVHPVATTGELYQSTSLTCKASGNPTPHIIWYKDNQIIPNTNSDPFVLLFDELSLDDRGFYHCEAITNCTTDSDVSEDVVLNIRGVVQYEGLVNISLHTEKDQPISRINELLTGKMLANGTTVLSVVELQNQQTIGDSNTLPILVTLVTEEGESNELLQKVQAEMKKIEAKLNVTITLDIWFDGCYSNITDIPSNSGNENLTISIEWPKTNIGEFAKVNCPCGNITSEKGSLIATRYCGGDFTVGSQWRNPNVAACNFSDLAREICQLAELETKARVQQLDEITKNSENLGSTEVIVSVTVLLTATEEVSGNQSLTDGFFNVADNILSVNEETLQQSQESSNTSSKIQEAIFAVAENIPLGNSSKPVTFTRSTFAVSIQQVEPEGFAGQNFSVNLGNFSEFNTSKNIDSDDLSFESMTTEQTAFIRLPNTLFDSISNISSNTRITHSIFLSDAAFLRRVNNLKEVGSVIISASVVGVDAVENIEPPLTITFRKNPDINGRDPSCTFWDQSLDDGYGNWSTRGCSVSQPSSESFVYCTCNHLTSFSILLDVSPKPEPTEDTPLALVLDAVTYIGIIISIFCLVVTIISYLSSKKLRTSEHGQLLLSLCFALMGLYITFVFAIHSRKVTGLCAFVAAVLQYFFLVTFMSMAAEAINLYIKLVVVLGVKIEKFVLKAVIVTWVVPFFIVLFCFAPSYKNYISDHFCRAFNVPYYIGMIVPFLIIYIFNWTIFVIIIISLTKKVHDSKRLNKKDDKQNVTFIRQQLIIATTLSVLFGLGWGIGLFATQDIHNNKIVRDSFAALFVIITAFHGLFMFLMHCVRCKDVRLVWKNLFLRATGKELSDLTSSTFERIRKKKEPKSKEISEFVTLANPGATTLSTHVQNETYDSATLRYQVAMHAKRSKEEEIPTYAEIVSDKEDETEFTEYDAPVRHIYDDPDVVIKENEEMKDVMKIILLPDRDERNRIGSLSIPDNTKSIAVPLPGIHDDPNSQSQ